MLTHDETVFYNREIEARQKQLRAAFAERGLPDWFETVSYRGYIFRDWHPLHLGRRHYGLEAHTAWDESGRWGFLHSTIRLLSYPNRYKMYKGKACGGFRTFREAREAAVQINAVLPPTDRFPLVEEVKLAMLVKERAIVYDVRQAEITERRRNLRLAETA